ncbi:transposase [Streptomyces sp. NBS 14/10]|nr:transposase [Streptomyces sp. NBS 14/10]KAK1185838.1 transposase [Streptomyces sp. NBS 14/10]
MPCPVKEQCTNSRKGRRLSLYPRELTEAIRTARAQQQDGTWQRGYALRAGVEGAIRQATHTTGLRRARYRGLAKTHLDHATSATALNLTRLQLRLIAQESELTTKIAQPDTVPPEVTCGFGSARAQKAGGW